jgi:hypothetical protein
MLETDNVESTTLQHGWNSLAVFCYVRNGGFFCGFWSRKNIVFLKKK